MKPWAYLTRAAAGAAAIAAALVLSACQQDEYRQSFDGVYFRTKTKSVNDNRLQFAATVQKAAQSLEGAREAAAYDATKYCIANYGTSRILWAVGPDAPADQLRLVDGDLTLTGECNP